MFLSQLDRNGKPQRACTPPSHHAIRASEALWQTLTKPLGHQIDSDGSILELGVCRNCGSTLARQPDPTTAAMLQLAIGGEL